MIVTLRRIITQIFGSAQIEQIDRISRTGAEIAARRDQSHIGLVGQGSAPESRVGDRSATVQPPRAERRPSRAERRP